jgi:hypothetical protein
MDWETLFAPVSTGALGAVTDILPVAIPVLVALVGIGIAIRVFGKFGVKK